MDGCHSSARLLLDTLSVLARTVGKDVFSPLASECVQLGLNLADTIDDPDLRRCTYVASYWHSSSLVLMDSVLCVSCFRYSLYSAVSTVNPDCLTPHLTAITTVMLLALKSNEGITVRIEHFKNVFLIINVIIK